MQRACVSLLSSQSQVMSSPLVIIDDMSPSIQYSGPWFNLSDIGDTRSISQTTDITSGAPFDFTLHGVNVSASFSFNFSGMPRIRKNQIC